MKKSNYLYLVFGLCYGFVATADDLMSKGMYQDKKTSLIWMRCSVGQKWNGKTCTGDASRLVWNNVSASVENFNNQVAFAGHSDWRLPIIVELSSIRHCRIGWQKDGDKVTMITVPNNNGGQTNLELRCDPENESPTINKRIFPNTEYFYWSSSSNNNASAWSVNFDYGYISDDKASNAYIRLVRDKN